MESNTIASLANISIVWKVDECKGYLLLQVVSRKMIIHYV